MNDLELIGYCRIHCQTERALFNGGHIQRMIRLAGSPKGFINPDMLKADEFYTAKHEMEELCTLASLRLEVQAKNALTRVEVNIHLEQATGVLEHCTWSGDKVQAAFRALETLAGAFHKTGQAPEALEVFKAKLHELTLEETKNENSN